VTAVSCSFVLIKLDSFVPLIECRVCDRVASCVRMHSHVSVKGNGGLEGISVAGCHPGRSRVRRDTIGHITMLRDGHIA
jgi:hypothetical protein